MAYIEFKNSSKMISASVIPIAKNIIRVKTSGKPNVSGFKLYLDKNKRFPMSKDEYEGYTTLYRTGDGWYELSNDGSTYEEPVTDAPEVITPTFDELKNSKIREMESAKAIAVSQGFNATLSNGTVEHFSLTGEDQLYLTALQTSVLAGVDPIPWHVSDDNVACKNYSNADMGIITQTALNIIVYHVTYLKDLIRYINSITTEEELATVTYGMIVPAEFQSEPLQTMMATANA